MKSTLQCTGELVTVNGHHMHVYVQGPQSAPAIVFMAGHCTIAPVYDFKVLYEKLLPDFRVIVIEKFGYGYSDIWDFPAISIRSCPSSSRRWPRSAKRGPIFWRPTP